MKNLLPALFLIFFSASTISQTVYFENNMAINQVYSRIPAGLKSEDRLEFISRLFLGQPYVLGALGEGVSGIYDSKPLYRFDGFDCQTYVSTMIALNRAHTPSSFIPILKQVRYQKGEVAYLQRNHFISTDWNISGEQEGFIKEYTRKIKTPSGEPAFQLTDTTIDKKEWLLKTKVAELKRRGDRDDLDKAAELTVLADKYQPQESRLAYIPLDVLFKEDKPQAYYFDQIPNGSIIEIVRPNWQLKDKIGTNLNVSHLGLAFWIDGVLIYREASSIENKIIDIPLTEYLQTYLNSPTIKGISIFRIEPTSDNNALLRDNARHV